MLLQRSLLGDHSCELLGDSAQLRKQPANPKERVLHQTVVVYTVEELVLKLLDVVQGSFAALSRPARLPLEGRASQIRIAGTNVEMWTFSQSGGLRSVPPRDGSGPTVGDAAQYLEVSTHAKYPI